MPACDHLIRIPKPPGFTQVEQQSGLTWQTHVPRASAEE